MNKRLLVSTALATVLLSRSIAAYSGTGGTPLGGMGSGYLVYNARTGGFKVGGAPGYNETSSNSAFHLYTKVDGAVKTKSKLSTRQEDAKIPIYRAEFGTTQNVDVKLLAFGPYNSGDEKLASLPLAFFEFTVTNNNDTPAEAAIALEFDNAIAGKNPQRRDNGIVWSGATNATVLTGAAGESTISAGTDVAGFLDDGVLGNSNGTVLGNKVALEAGATATIQFVVSWFRDFGEEDFYYYNYYSTSLPIAQYGLENFETIRDGAVKIVQRTMAVNLPEWFKDRLLNNLYPLIHNAQMAEDGRVAFIEGRWPIIGTLDQQGHAQIPVSFLWPDHNWRQMEYWARTQMRGSKEGQIHHDFNGGSGVHLCDWDDHDHANYPFGGNIGLWADLNCMFILNNYEILLGSGNLEKFTELWPYIKKTGGRLLVQCSWGGADSYLPKNTKSTYDRSTTTDIYNSSLALAAFSAMKEMALIMDEPDEAEMWREQFANAKPQYVERYYSPSLGTGEYAESHLGGYPFARSLGLPAIIDDDKAQTIFDRMYEYYEDGTSTYEWHVYTNAHFADLGISIGKTDEGLTNHHASWKEYYQEKTEYIFWQDIDKTLGYYSYMTAPLVWRTLFLVEGYMIDQVRDRLWIRPNLPSGKYSVDGELTNAPLITADSWGTLDYQEPEDGVVVQKMWIRFDNEMSFKEIILRNNAGDTPGVTVVKGGATLDNYSVAQEGSGLDAVLVISFPETIGIDNAGIRIDVTNDGSQPVRPRAGIVHSSSPAILSFSESALTLRTADAEPLRIELLDLHGRVTTTRCFLPGRSGIHTVPFDGRGGSGVSLIRVRAGDSRISRQRVMVR